MEASGAHTKLYPLRGYVARPPCVPRTSSALNRWTVSPHAGGDRADLAGPEPAGPRPSSPSRLEGENAALKQQLLRCKGAAWRECSEILPRRLCCRGGASVVRRDAAW